MDKGAFESSEDNRGKTVGWSQRVSGGKTRAYAPVQPHVGQTPVEGDHVAGHQVKLVNFKQLLHFVLLVLGDDHRLAHLARTLVAPRYHSCNRGGDNREVWWEFRPDAGLPHQIKRQWNKSEPLQHEDWMVSSCVSLYASFGTRKTLF